MTRKKETVVVTDNAVVPLEEGVRALVQTDTGDLIEVPPWGTPLCDCPSDMDLTAQHNFVLAFNAVGEADLHLDKNGEVVVRAKHWLIHPAEAVDEETGEVRRFARLVLIQADGQTFATTSGVVMARLAQLAAYYGDHCDWQEVSLRVVERKSGRSGRRYHDLRIVPEECS